MADRSCLVLRTSTGSRRATRCAQSWTRSRPRRSSRRSAVRTGRARCESDQRDSPLLAAPSTPADDLALVECAASSTSSCAANRSTSSSQPPVRPWTGVTPSPLSQPPSLLASALVEAHHVHHPVTALPMSPHCRGDSVSAQGAAHAGRSHNQHDRQSGHLSHLLNASWHRSGSRAHLHRRVGARRARCPTSRSGTASLAKRCQRRALPGR
jgi:hypothetical protein